MELFKNRRRCGDENCKTCSSEKDCFSYEIRRPTCITAMQNTARPPWFGPCTCTTSRNYSPPPPMHNRFGREAALHTRSQLETIMNEMSDCCPVRPSIIPVHHSRQVCRQDLWMNQMRFRYMYKSSFKQQMVGVKDVMKPKRFQCMYCEKSFGKSSHLRDHVRTHTGERPFRCSWCNKAFTQYSNLRTHMRIHTGEKPYSCKLCLKSFTQAVTLRSHLRTHNIDDEPKSPKKLTSVEVVAEQCEK